jgi:hypothetical protein
MKERDETTKEEMEAKKEAAESWRRSKIWHRRRNSLFNRWEMISSRPKLKSDLAILPVAHDNEARNPSVPFSVGVGRNGNLLIGCKCL